MDIAVYDNLGQARRKSMSSRRDSHKSPFKMKPVPHDIHFEEVTMLNFSESDPKIPLLAGGRKEDSEAILPRQVHQGAGTRGSLRQQKGWPCATLLPRQVFFCPKP